MPAEWSPHLATWISWPHNRDTWPGVLEGAEAAMTEAVAALTPHEHVHINVLDAEHGRRVASLLEGRAAPDRFSLEPIATDDAWIRDYGAIIVRDDDSPAGFSAIDFDYNAWGNKYPPFDRDRAVAAGMAGRLGLPRVASRMVLEGGSVDVNGDGLGLVTEQCLLNPNRNPSMRRGQIESELAALLGLSELIWLGDGVIGDDTDGHIDNLARFVAPRRVVTVVASSPDDPNHAALAENRRRLDVFRDRRGQGLEVAELPVPPTLAREGQPLPGSYANFYIANGVVLVPAYGGENDAIARAVIADCFPDRQIVPIDCRSLIVGLGALHCLTQQIPVMVRGVERAR
jgi:agmatine deiminase